MYLLSNYCVQTDKLSMKTWMYFELTNALIITKTVNSKYFIMNSV